jgi:hypothetical protein
MNNSNDDFVNADATHDFLYVDRLIDGKVLRIAFLGATCFRPAQVSKSLTRAMYETGAIDSLIVLCDEVSANEIQQFWAGEIEGTLPKRYPSVAISIYGYLASVAKPTLVGRFGAITEEKFCDEHVRSLTKALTSICSPLELAPDGSYFAKSEDRKSVYFLRAARLAKYESAQYFLAALALEKIETTLHVLDLRTIHIDTNSIAPVAYAFATLVARAKKNVSAKACSVRSFESYKSFGGLVFGSSFAEVVLVSASSSASLPKRLAKERGIQPRSMITLIGEIDAHQIYGLQCVIDVGLLTGIAEAKQRQHQSKYRGSPIVVSDEDFNFHTAKPVSIVLTRPAHAPIRWSKIEPQLSLAEQMKPIVRAATFGAPPGDLSRLYGRAVQIDVPAILGSSSFAERLSSFLDQHVGALRGALIVVAEENEVHAETLKQKVKSMLDHNPSCFVLTHKVLENKLSNADLRTVKRVIIVAPAISSGWVLEDVSRTVRDQFPTADRAFFVGVWLSPTLRRADILRRNISLSSVGKPFPLEAMARIPIGYSLIARSERSGWTAELNLLREREKQNKVFAKRISALTNPTQDDVVWDPETEQPMKLTQTFAFWGNTIQIDRATHHQTDVLITIAAVLQNAREYPVDASDYDKHCLAQHPYERRLLSSENFFRYNDPLLQSVLLRAAERYELNYSDNPEESDSISEYVVSMIAAPSSTRRRALYEFLLAIQLGKLRLTHDAIKRIDREIKKQEDRTCWFANFLGPIA